VRTPEVEFHLAGGCRLRALSDSDAPELFALVDANRAHLEPWMPWVPNHRDARTSLEFIRSARRQVADNDGLQLAIVDPDGRLAGVVGFHSVDWRRRTTSIGYWLAADRQGHGTMTSAVRALVGHAFDTWGLKRVEIRAATDNLRSRAIPERLGFRREGVAQRAERVGNRYHDHVIYGMGVEDWERLEAERRARELARVAVAVDGDGHDHQGHAEDLRRAGQLGQHDDADDGRRRR
jgi:ribosomal-protein-serine acetyltransferase